MTHAEKLNQNYQYYLVDKLPNPTPIDIAKYLEVQRVVFDDLLDLLILSLDTKNSVDFEMPYIPSDVDMINCDFSTDKDKEAKNIVISHNDKYTVLSKCKFDTFIDIVNKELENLGIRQCQSVGANLFKLIGILIMEKKIPDNAKFDDIINAIHDNQDNTSYNKGIIKSSLKNLITKKATVQNTTLPSIVDYVIKEFPDLKYETVIELYTKDLCYMYSII